jgi:DNA-binding beta-propeller fold protein YncE
MKCVVTGLFLMVSLSGAADYKIIERYPLPGTGGWDYVTVDSAARRVYISHATQVEVVDADNGKLIGTISDTPGVHGVAIAPGEKHGFTSNGRENKVSMFEPESLKLIKKIDVGKGPDGIWYDAATNRVFTNNHGSHDITAIDAKSGEVAGTVKLAGDGEQAIKGSDGLYYVNSEDTAEVVAFDPKSLEVKHRYPVGVAETPTGLAYDAKTSRLFIACRREPKMVVMDAKTGKVITSYPIGTGADWAEFDAASKTVLVSTGQGVLNTFLQKSADVYEGGVLTTQAGAKTMGIDPKTKKIFLPAAEYDMKPNADPARPPVRTMKPGSFVLLVVSK